MKILITGINGLVGKDVASCLGINSEYEILGIGRSDACYAPNVKYARVDICDMDKLSQCLAEWRPEAIIHCAAMTKIDQCEEDREQAKKTNVDAARVLAEYGCRMIYMSSDGVFNGKSEGNYRETDAPNAENFYGKTKALGEQAVLASNKNAVSLRMSIYGYNINQNMSVAQWAAMNIRKQIPIKGFTDVRFNPLYSKQIVCVMRRLLKSDYAGVLNLGCREVVSKYELFCLMAKKMGMPDSNISPASVDSMTFKAPRTKDTSLNVDRLRDVLGLEFTLRDGMDEFYHDYLRWL